jgi:predicted DNA-binding protein (UPF0278 family)
MRHLKIFESHTDRTVINDLGNADAVKDAVMKALKIEYPIMGKETVSKQVRDYLGDVMFSYAEKTVETINDSIDDIAEVLDADVPEIAFTIGAAIWSMDPSVVEKNVKMFEEFTENVPTSAERGLRITPENIDSLTFKAYVNRSKHIVDTLENINKYAKENGLKWMWWSDNGYSHASESPSTFENVKKGILNHSHGRTIYLSTGDGFTHSTNS